MINLVSGVNFNNNITFSGKNWNKVLSRSFNDSFEYSDAVKYSKKIFNYAPQKSKPVETYLGSRNYKAGFSTEDIEDVGGGYLKADCSVPLSTTGVRTCAVLNAVDEKTNENVLWHVHHETPVKRIEEFLRKFLPDFTKVNIVGGDRFKTAVTMKKIVQAVENINPYAEKTYYHTVSENPELVAYDGGIYYVKGKKGTVSFVQKDDYWY